MAYILAAQRDQGGIEAQRLRDEYGRYLQANAASFPPSAFALATSDWYYDFRDHRTPHDSWLEWARFEEHATGERQQTRSLSLHVRLLGAYHDNYLEFFYPNVYSYTLTHAVTVPGHRDWRYDEFRLSSQGHLIHEIEWAGPAGSDGRWIIEASDVQFTSNRRAAV